MNIFREILMHASVVCCFTGAITMILDWYNPYMDFAGHLKFTQVIMYAAVPILVLTAGCGKRMKLQ